MFLKEKANSVSQNLLSKRIVDINKKFFYIKNNYKEEIKELQDSLGVSLNFVEFIEEQYKIIRELDEDGNLVRETFGTFEERKEISDEELTRMTQEFLKRH